jgi:hypothetical protein
MGTHRHARDTVNELLDEMNELTGRSWRGTSCKSRIIAAKYRVTQV